MSLPTIKVVEHPDLFVQRSEYSLEDFDYIIELRETEDQEITYEQLNKMIYLQMTIWHLEMDLDF